MRLSIALFAAALLIPAAASAKFINLECAKPNDFDNLIRVDTAPALIQFALKRDPIVWTPLPNSSISDTQFYAAATVKKADGTTNVITFTIDRASGTMHLTVNDAGRESSVDAPCNVTTFENRF